MSFLKNKINITSTSFLIPNSEAWKDLNNPLSSRIIIAPHTAFYSETAWYEMRFKAAENAARIIKGQDPLNIINS